jgi:ribosomal-protein-alanine N-acetyltransferase
MQVNVDCLPENYSSYFYRDLYQRFPRTFLVSLVEGSIQGYIMCRIERGFSKLHTFKPARQCHVVSIAVRKAYRRRGIASQLLLEAMRNAREDYNVVECFLEVRLSNEPAIALYESLGFHKVKKSFRYYMDGEDAWVMAIDLKN